MQNPMLGHTPPAEDPTIFLAALRTTIAALTVSCFDAAGQDQAMVTGAGWAWQRAPSTPSERLRDRPSFRPALLVRLGRRRSS
jgi:hypothetical protein